jgi:type I restriction enzyme S subunit
MAVKPGYKQTEIGVVPVEWGVQSGEQATTLIGKGGSPRWQGFEYSNQGMLFVTSENVRDGFLDIREPKYLPLAFHEKLKRTKLQKHDILINLVGASIGRSCQLHGDLGEANVNQAVAVFRVKEGICSEFVACCFQAPTTIKRVLEMQVDAARPNISLGDLRRFLIPLPLLPEQRAIATALSDVDALLVALERLVAKKRDLKQAAMQQLLTGQTRLPDFHGEWEVKQLGELATFLKGKGLPKSALVLDGTAPCIHYGELFTRYPETIGKILSRTNDWRDSVLSVANDVLMPTSDVTPRGLAKASCVTVNGVVLGGDILVIRSDKQRVFGPFLSYIIRREEVQVLRLVTGSTVYHLYGSDMKRFIFSLPPLSEQAAIAAVLTDMDAELAALEQRVAKTQALKQGMMQELLTGRTRLL